MPDNTPPGPVPTGAQTRVPTALRANVTLPPGGTETITLKVDQDTLLYGLTVEAAGPMIVEYRITEAPATSASSEETPQTFQEYLEREYPTHLAALAGEDLATWERENAALHQRAVGGDDDAFFALLARDPRQLSSELTLGRVVTWRTAVETYTRFYRFKASRVLVPGDAATRAEAQMEQARRNLARLGASQLEPYDLRGRRPLPPAPLVRGIYHGLLCLLRVLRMVQEHDEVNNQAIRDVAAVTAEMERVRHGFLYYVALGAHLIRDAGILEDAGLGAVTLATLVSGRGMSPVETARLLTGAAFGVSPDTVERLATQPVAIPLPPEGSMGRFLAGPRSLDPLQLDEVKALIAQLTR